VSAAPATSGETSSPQPPLQKSDSLLGRIGYCVAEHYGLLAVAGGVGALGIPIPKAWVLERTTGFAGTSGFMSLASVIGEKVFGEGGPRLAQGILGTARIFGVIGRAAFPIAIALASYDAISISYCVYQEDTTVDHTKVQ
jgi:hypothetical protein